MKNRMRKDILLYIFGLIAGLGIAGIIFSFTHNNHAKPAPRHTLGATLNRNLALSNILCSDYSALKHNGWSSREIYIHLVDARIFTKFGKGPVYYHALVRWCIKNGY